MQRVYRNTEIDWSEFDHTEAAGQVGAPPPAEAASPNVSGQPIAKSDDTIIRMYQNTELDWSEFDRPEDDEPVSAERQALLKGQQGSGSGLVDMLKRMSAPAAAPAPAAPQRAPAWTPPAHQLPPLPPAQAPLHKSGDVLADSMQGLAASLRSAASSLEQLHKSAEAPRYERPRPTLRMTAAQAQAMGRAAAAPQRAPLRKSAPEIDAMLSAVQDATRALRGLVR